MAAPCAIVSRHRHCIRNATSSLRFICLRFICLRFICRRDSMCMNDGDFIRQRLWQLENLVRILYQARSHRLGEGEGVSDEGRLCGKLFRPEEHLGGLHCERRLQRRDEWLREQWSHHLIHAVLQGGHHASDADAVLPLPLPFPHLCPHSRHDGRWDLLWGWRWRRRNGL
jgi:hypothetical protein